jgi:hypothetical protein
MSFALSNTLLSVNDQPFHSQDELAARILIAELKTRVTTRPLHFRSGSEEAAFHSVASLFDRVRELVAKYPKARRFEIVATSMLNDVIARNTDRWRKWLVDDSFQNDDQRRIFRSELSKLRAGAHRVQSILNRIARNETLLADDLTLGYGLKIESEPKSLSPSADAHIPFGIRHESHKPDELARILKNKTSEREELETELKSKKEARDKPHWFDIKNPVAQFKKWREFRAAIRKAENELATARESEKEVQWKVNLNDAEGTELKRRRPGAVGNAAGLAFSGGGIRSATFALGVAQFLARKGFFERFDYLSTVSGGGYLGAFITDKCDDQSPKDLLVDKQSTSDTEQVRHLRNHSKYLANGGFLEPLIDTVLGVLVNLLLLFVIIVVLAKLTAMLTGLWGEINWLTMDTTTMMQSLCPLGWPTIPRIAAWSILVRAALFLSALMFWRKPIQKLARPINVIAVVLCALAIIPLLIGWLKSISGNSHLIPASGLSLSAVVGILAAVRIKKNAVRSVAFVLLWLTGPCMLILGYLWLTMIQLESTYSNWYLLLYLVLFALAFVPTPNVCSLQRHYRNRLIKCYLGKGERRLSNCNTDSSCSPYHLINATVNLRDERLIDLRGRDGDFFLFSKRFSGSPILGYAKTTEFETRDKDLNLGTAMAASGAAVSANMGVLESGPFRFLMAIFNLKLGYWQPNGLRTFPKSALICLFNESLGRLRKDSSFVNVSDGGHIENLGVYELLRRHAKFVVAVDAECDAEFRFDGLVKLIRYARIDMAIEIEIDVSDMRPNRKELSGSHSAFGKIIYPDRSVGWLVYIKLSLTGNEPAYVLDYKRAHPSFPHESTLDQLFSEQQFEAYRRLGEHAAEDLFRPELFGVRDGVCD